MTNATPPGWYPDNLDISRVRWWDGSGWTDQTQLKQQTNEPRGYPGQPQSQPQAPAQPSISTPSAPARPAAQLPGQSRQHQQTPDPYAQPAQQPQQVPNDPYAAKANQQPAFGQYGQLQPSQQVPQQQTDSYPGEGRIQRFNDSIAQGYGDQTYGGYTSGPTDGRQAAQGRNVFTEPVLVVSQKRKIIEVTNEYSVYAQDGSQLGAVVEVGQSGMKKAVRLLTSYDQFLTHRLEVRDNGGNVLLRLTRPAKVMKSTIIVQAPDGREIGRLVQQNVFGKIRFGLLAGGVEVGSLNAENWRAWNFALKDTVGAEVARVTKTWEGLLTTMFTTADNYVVHIHQDVPDPLRSLCVAAALTIDTALKQDER